MIEFVQQLAWWHWLIAAAVLAAAETLVPGAVAIWFAAGAAIVGALLLLVPLPWQLQLLLFGALSVAALFLWRRYRSTGPESGELPRLNRRGEQYIGQLCTLLEPISGGYGRARVGDTVWKVRGPELPSGARVRVTGADGTVLTVEAAGGS
ncbi:MAG: NfeD family protein [Gammaproteobacteria bacterium]|nr:NfeD family protein [Gammaproteobacteria bacterium]